MAQISATFTANAQFGSSDHEIMATMRSVVPPIQQPLHRQLSSTARKTPENQGLHVVARRPQCTHITMKRIYGDKVACHMCGQPSRMGWVYACTQAYELDQQVPPAEVADSLPEADSSCDYFEEMAQLAEHYRMHPFTVSAIRNGDYTIKQTNKMITQKGSVFATINGSKKPFTEAAPRAQSTDKNFTTTVKAVAAELGIAKDGLSVTVAGTPCNTPLQSATTSPVKQAIKASRKPPCNFQVCHTCRPFFIDRTYMSFESVMSGELPMVTETEMLGLPMKHAAIVRNLGLRSRPLPTPPFGLPSLDSMDVTMVHGEGYEYDISDLSPDTTTTSDSELDSIDMRDPYPCPGGQHCQHWNPLTGCAYDSGFDDGLRALNHGFGPEPDLTRMTPENSSNSLRHAFGGVAGTPGSASSTASSLSVRTPRTPAIIVTPIGTDEDEKSFEETLNIRLSKVGKAASVTGASLDTIGESFGGAGTRAGKAASVSGASIDHMVNGDIFGRSSPVRDTLFGRSLSAKTSKSSLGSEVEVEGGVALTEEAVSTRSPDVATGNDDD